MKLRYLYFYVVVSLSSLLILASPAHATTPTDFAKRYCFKCHGTQVQKADRRFDQLSVAIRDTSELEVWQDILDQLNLGEMPPADEPQPTPAELKATIHFITRSIAAAQAKFHATGRHTVMRRLNRFEYRNTVCDLLGLNAEAWDPAQDFPADDKVDGFDNNGAALVTSGMLLDHYLLAAEEAIHRSTHFGEPPASQTYAQKSPFYFPSNSPIGKGLSKLFHVDRFRFTPDTPFTDLYGRHYRGGHIGFVPLAHRGVRHSGVYTVRVRAAAVDRNHDYGNALSDFRNGDPLVLALTAVNREGSVTSTGSVADERHLISVELTSEEPAWFEWDVYLEQGYEPEVRFNNGPIAAKRLVRVLLNVADDHEELMPFKDMKSGMEKAHGVLKAYRGPKLRIWEIQLEGPHIKQWPPAGHRLLYGDLAAEDIHRNNVVPRLRVFAKAAFRRPLADGELRPIEDLVVRKIESGIAPLDALQLGFQTILCSPRFLFLNEGSGQLDDFRLASRLSYFFWSSKPDQELLRLANNGDLADEPQLKRQINRMLADPKSNRFIENFVRRWLELDNIGEMPPSPDFIAYYRDHLKDAMNKETTMLFRHVLDNNLSSLELIAADYSFLNRQLAQHYGIAGVEGGEFQQVSLSGSKRGGVLTHGSFLTASANGVDTSPVVRGIYVLDKLLGYTPPSSPDDVPSIEPDIRGAATIREQLVKHRDQLACAECHRKIDPPGFALENFNAIGAWRDEYGKNLPVDSTGHFADGESFSDVDDFRGLLIERHESFHRCLTEKLLTYAIGRQLEVGDRPAIDKILKESQARGYGLQTLIEQIVISDVFQSN